MFTILKQRSGFCCVIRNMKIVHALFELRQWWLIIANN